METMNTSINQTHKNLELSVTIRKRANWVTLSYLTISKMITSFPLGKPTTCTSIALLWTTVIFWLTRCNTGQANHHCEMLK